MKLKVMMIQLISLSLVAGCTPFPIPVFWKGDQFYYGKACKLDSNFFAYDREGIVVLYADRDQNVVVRLKDAFNEHEIEGKTFNIFEPIEVSINSRYIDYKIDTSRIYFTGKAVIQGKERSVQISVRYFENFTLPNSEPLFKRADCESRP